MTGDRRERYNVTPAIGSGGHDTSQRDPQTEVRYLSGNNKTNKRETPKCMT